MSTQTRARRTGTQQIASKSFRDFRTFLLVQQFEAREIGARIKQARKEKGLTQEEIAEMSSFSKRSLQDYENGVTLPYKHLRELGRLLGRDVEWFLHGDEEEDERLTDLEGRVAALQEGLSDVHELRVAVERIEELVLQLLARTPGAARAPSDTR